MRAVSTPASVGSTLFVGSHLDDAGLNVFQFRILGHLHRRAGSDGRAWPSVNTIAEVCKIGERVVRRSLRELVKMGYVKATPRPGRTTLYRPASAGGMPADRSASPPPPLADRLPPPLANRPAEGIPSEGIPTNTTPVVHHTPPQARPARQVVVGGWKASKTVQSVKNEPLPPDKALQHEEAAVVLGEHGIIGPKLESLARSGLTAKEIRRTCKTVIESGGRSGAMVLHLEAAAARKARGHLVDANRFAFVPAAPVPAMVDDLTEDDRAEVLGRLRDFRLRQAG